ncbi:MAG: tetratricopeptide repeat protein [Deltaproteobacteria bacterium]|nr:tetratricopeptide repeat protein [Deltaproteobacteria bacterium]
MSSSERNRDLRITEVAPGDDWPESGRRRARAESPAPVPVSTSRSRIAIGLVVMLALAAMALIVSLGIGGGADGDDDSGVAVVEADSRVADAGIEAQAEVVDAAVAAAPTVPDAAARTAVDAGKAEPRPTNKPEPRSASKLYQKGTRAFLAGKLQSARRHFRRAVEANPRYAPAYRGLGLVYQRQGKRRAAIRYYRRYLRLAPSARDSAAIRARIEKLK